MRQYLWSFLHRAAGTGFSAVLALVLGNLLLPGEMGLYVAIMMVASYAVATLSLGIDKSVVQKLNDAALSDRRDAYFTAGGLAAGALAVVVPLSLALFASPLQRLFDLTGAPSLYTLALPLVFLLINNRYYTACLQADQEFRRLVVVRLLSSTVKLLGALSLLELGYGLPGLMVGIYAGELTELLLLAVSCYRSYDVALGAPTVIAARDTLGFGLVIHLSAVAVFLDKNVDLLLVNYYLEKADLAVYNYAMRGALLLLLLGNAVSGVTYPRLTAAFTSGDTERVKRLYSGGIKVVFTILSVGALGALIHIRPLVTLVLPEYYLRLVSPFTLLVVAMVLFGAVAAVGTVLTAKGVPQYGAFINWGAAALNGVLCLILIPRYGVMGAAAATGGTFALRSVVSLIVADQLFETGLDALSFGSAVVGFTASVAAIGLLDPPAVVGWSLWLVYCGLIAALLWDHEDREVLRERVRGLLGENT